MIFALNAFKRQRLRLAQMLALTMLFSSCPQAAAQAEPKDKESMRPHYDGKRFYNTSGADKSAGEIARFFWENISKKTPWPK